MRATLTLYLNYWGNFRKV